MGIYDTWPSLVGTGLMLALAATPLFKPVQPPVADIGGRLDTLDGLRGLLALSVFFDHAAIYHAYLLHDVWELPPVRFYALLGQVGVALFFVTTGYLFWDKVLKDDGRPDLVQLYIGRVFRIGPLYLVAIVVLFSLVFSRTGPHLNQPVTALAKAAVKWLSLGAFGGGPNLNGDIGTYYLTAGVTWTLRYEWAFYASLALTARLGRLRSQVTLCGLALAACLGYVAWRVPADAPAPHAFWATLFVIGMFVAAVQRRGWRPMVPSPWASVLTLLLLASVFLCGPSVKAVLPTVLLGAAFLLIVQGADLFGLLTSPAARRLGAISYGVYLLQGLVLAVVCAAPAVRRFALVSPLHHWAVMGGCAACLVAVAGVLHAAVERPGIALGRRVGRRIRLRANRRAAARLAALAAPLPPRAA